ncbi:hypothetical protein DL768_006433 [Monosporascus sp. mg162]|nr:hypothetical protein DL768_006433 [Monosporascus sp. mg162]
MSPQTPFKLSEVVPSATYIERGQRWMEKEEVGSLRRAMDAMDLKDSNSQPEDDDEKRLYNAALDEAAELVWRHQHGVKPPEPGTPYQYRSHLRKNSYAQARAASIRSTNGLTRDSTCSLSGSSSGSEAASSSGSARGNTDQSGNFPAGSRKPTSYAAVGSAPRPGSGGHRRRSSMRRNISGEVEKPFSGDQIWEEPEGSNASESAPRQTGNSEAPSPLKSKTRNSLSRIQFAPESPQPPASASPKLLSNIEIYRNPPSQSRNPNYRTNSPPPTPTTVEEVPKKNGIEIRGDDIRQATSMRLKDRSAKLPTPSAVSDSPGRPIVSFDRNWKAPEEATDRASEESGRVPFRHRKSCPGQDSAPHVPTITATADAEATPPPSRPSDSPLVPSTQVEDDRSRQVPAIAVSDERPAVPTIVLPGDEGSTPNIPAKAMPDNGGQKPSARPLPTPGAANAQARKTFEGRPRSHWSPAPNATTRATALCHECGSPIQGRFIALRGSAERFHPQCFRCYACGTSLEALEISPEPDAFRNERLDRIRRRAAGENLEEAPGKSMAEDGDERLRFYCHLDWHELFAPRCKHCRTPILGEHIVALGAHWHYGHFFCAECGDPFEQGMTHIEKDGYAWCINCQTKRTERRAPKCKRCRTAVIGQYIMALGGEWHEECFRCASCHGGFDDGQIFPMKERGEAVVLCTKCRAMELKM